jgi:hypothetical protein
MRVTAGDIKPAVASCLRGNKPHRAKSLGDSCKRILQIVAQANAMESGMNTC